MDSRLREPSASLHPGSTDNRLSPFLAEAFAGFVRIRTGLDSTARCLAAGGERTSIRDTLRQSQFITGLLRGQIEIGSRDQSAGDDRTNDGRLWQENNAFQYRAKPSYTLRTVMQLKSLNFSNITARSQDCH